MNSNDKLDEGYCRHESTQATRSFDGCNKVVYYSALLSGEIVVLYVLLSSKYWIHPE